MKSKKIITGLVLSATMAMSLSAAALAFTQDSGSDEPVVLNFYYWDEGQKEGMDAVIALFEANHENITIESTVIPWSEYWAKIDTSLPNGSGPDIFWMNLYVEPYIKAGLLYDMTDNIAADGVDMSAFPETITSAYTSEGRIYGIPKDADGTGIYYNKAIFDEMNVEYPTEGWTTEDFRNTALALTNDVHYGFAQDNYRAFIDSFGGTFTNEDHTEATYNSPEAAQALQFLRDMMFVDKSAANGADLTEMNAGDMFVGGSAAMVAAGSWNIGKYAEALGDNLGIMEVPGKGANTSGLCYAISAKSTNTEAAWEFCKFAATTEAQNATVSAAIPANVNSTDAWLAQYADIDGAQYLTESILNAISNPYFANGTTAECDQIEKDYISEIFLYEDADIQAILEGVTEKINTTIAEAAK